MLYDLILKKNECYSNIEKAIQSCGIYYTILYFNAYIVWFDILILIFDIIF